VKFLCCGNWCVKSLYFVNKFLHICPITNTVIQTDFGNVFTEKVPTVVWCHFTYEAFSFGLNFCETMIFYTFVPLKALLCKFTLVMFLQDKFLLLFGVTSLVNRSVTSLGHQGVRIIF